MSLFATMHRYTVALGTVRFFLMTGREAVWNVDFLLFADQGEDRPLQNMFATYGNVFA